MAFGIDIGRAHDHTVIVIAEEKDDLVYVRNVVVLNGLPFDIQQRRIKEESDQYGPDAVAVDTTGIGMEMGERLRMDLGALVLEYKFTDESKSELIGVAYDLWTSNKVRVPAKYRVVREEFANIRKVTSPAGNVLYRDEPHGDISWAAALAFYALRYLRGGGVVMDASSLFRAYAERRVPEIFLPPEVKIERVSEKTEMTGETSAGQRYPLRIPDKTCPHCARVFLHEAALLNHVTIDHPEP